VTTDGDREDGDQDDEATGSRPAPDPGRRVRWGSEPAESGAGGPTSPSAPPLRFTTPAPPPTPPVEPPRPGPPPLVLTPTRPTIDAPRSDDDQEPTAPPPPPPRREPARPKAEDRQPPPRREAARTEPPRPEAAPPAPPASPPPAREAPPSERRTSGRGCPAIGELAQQLAATQAQVASISAQLTTLAHRITYDLERGAQTTSERILRDLEHLPDQVSFRVGAHLGPAVDDLTEQVETDSERLRKLVEEDFSAKLALISETVETLPLGTAELLNGLQTVAGDLEDRMTRFSTRVTDQVAALERATQRDLNALREHVDELKATAQPKLDTDVLDRMAGQVERLAERPAPTSEVVDAVELLISEHLEVLRDNVETRVAALAPVLHDELEAVRAESLASVTATEEALVERIEQLEAGVAERVEGALGEQVEALDALVADRHSLLLNAVTSAGDERIEELAGTLASVVDRLEEVMAAVVELQETGLGGEGDPMAAVNEELKALRRRISLRMESPDEPQGLTPEQLRELAAQIALHLS
jgi:uncharacterized coiled-coil protein SlyX